jgi:hypothetical protein
MSATRPASNPVALLAEFTDVDGVMTAARGLRDAGFRNWDVHSPFPIHGIDAAMGIRPTRLPWMALIGGITGLFAGLLLAWWTNAVDYTFLISGKPRFSLPANIPVIFETTVLFAALATVFGMLLLNRLPTLYNPLLNAQRFRRVTDDRFMIVVEAIDQRFDAHRTPELLASLGAVHVELVEEE